MRSTGAAKPRVLVADDQPDVRDAVQLLLKGEGFSSVLVDSPKRAVAALAESDFDLALIDLNYARDTTSGQEGLDLITRIRSLDGTLPIVVMTAWGSIELAVEAIRRGATDFVQKPWENTRLLTTLRTQIDLGRAVRQREKLAAENALNRAEGLQTLIAESEAMKPILDVVDRVGPSDANVLVTGENGTGKGLIAKTIHAVSTRSGRSFVSVNMGGLPETVFESELFGHVRGAFTDAKTDRVGRFELADGGTLFLDEIANIPLQMQSRLLRVVETGEFERVGSSRTHHSDARVICATNANLQAEVAAGRFRQDLLFRLNTVEIRLPPLRERRDDIPHLAMHFLNQHACRYRKEITAIDTPAMRALVEHSWPGNVRELDHTVERAVLMAQGSVIQCKDLGLFQPADAEVQLEQLSIEDVERLLIQKALARFGGNARRAAETLGLSRSAFYRRLEKHGL